jgi:ankyrin repeat protein
MLTELGASLGVMKSESRQRTPLHVAACCGKYQICEYLLHKGASLSLLDKGGFTAMDLAIMTGHPKCDRLFLGLASPSSTIMDRGISLTTFVFGLGYRFFSKLMSSYQEKTYRDPDPRSPESALPMLESRASDDNSKLFDVQPGSAAQDSFKFEDMADVLQALHSPGCDLDAKDKFGSKNLWTDRKSTALHHACSIGSLGLISFLLTKGAEVNPRNDAGQTPLHKACFWYGTSRETIQKLVQHGANLNALDEYSRSPLDEACMHASVEVVQCLVTHGAVIKACGDNNCHPLNYACMRDTHSPTVAADTTRIIDYIVSSSDPEILSAEYRSWDNSPLTPLHLAIQKRNWEAVEHLQALGAKITDPSCLSHDLWSYAADAHGGPFRRLLGLGASTSGKCSFHGGTRKTIIAH